MTESLSTIEYIAYGALTLLGAGLLTIWGRDYGKQIINYFKKPKLPPEQEHRSDNIDENRAPSEPYIRPKKDITNIL